MAARNGPEKSRFDRQQLIVARFSLSRIELVPFCQKTHLIAYKSIAGLFSSLAISERCQSSAMPKQAHRVLVSQGTSLVDDHGEYAALAATMRTVIETGPSE